MWFELRLGLSKASEARIKSTMCVCGCWLVGAWCLVRWSLKGLGERGSLCRFRFEPRTSPRSPSSGGREGGGSLVRQWTSAFGVEREGEVFPCLPVKSNVPVCSMVCARC